MFNVNIIFFIESIHFFFKLQNLRTFLMKSNFSAEESVKKKEAVVQLSVPIYYS